MIAVSDRDSAALAKGQQMRAQHREIGRSSVSPTCSIHWDICISIGHFYAFTFCYVKIQCQTDHAPLQVKVHSMRIHCCLFSRTHLLVQRGFVSNSNLLPSSKEYLGGTHRSRRIHAYFRASLPLHWIPGLEGCGKCPVSNKMRITIPLFNNVRKPPGLRRVTAIYDVRYDQFLVGRCS